MVMISLNTSSHCTTTVTPKKELHTLRHIHSIAQALSTPSFSSNISFRFPSQMPLLQQPTVTDLTYHGF
jgi:hypothetical protein